MASEEVNRILENLQKLREQKEGKAVMEDEKDEADILAEELKKTMEQGENEEKENILKEAKMKEEISEQLEPEKDNVEEVKPVKSEVQRKIEPVKPSSPKEDEVEKVSLDQEAMVQAEIEALNNDGVFRHALLLILADLNESISSLAQALKK